MERSHTVGEGSRLRVIDPRAAIPSLGGAAGKRAAGRSLVQSEPDNRQGWRGSILREFLFTR